MTVCSVVDGQACTRMGQRDVHAERTDSVRVDIGRMSSPQVTLASQPHGEGFIVGADLRFGNSEGHEGADNCVLHLDGW